MKIEELPSLNMLQHIENARLKIAWKRHAERFAQSEWKPPVKTQVAV